MKALRRGSMLMEAVIVLPVLVMLIFAVLHFAHLMIVQQVVEYAAYCGARATLTTNALTADAKAKDAVLRVLAPVALENESDTSESGPQYIPGWGNLQGTKDFDKRVRVSITNPLVAGTTRTMSCTVEYDYPIIMPIPFTDSTNKVFTLKGHAVMPFRVSTLRYPLEIN